jgi:glycosyltransferase involved in cell wall biosynthesis
VENNRCKILFLEPFAGGSHKDFARGITGYTQHDITLVTMPARFWKWRMRGAALHFYRSVKNPESYNLIFTTDLMSFSDLKALWGSRCPKGIVYFHENQLSYPLPEGEKMDYQFGFTDITTCLTADKIIFNSRFHRNTFLAHLPGFIRKMPEYRPAWIPEEIKQKSSVIHPGIHVPPPESELPGITEPEPLIIWNHRWEFDKQPEVFFRVLCRLAEGGIPFRVAVLGENFQKVPKPFLKAKKLLPGRIIHYGYAERREDYEEWLLRGDIVISTAVQENFGISIAEAAAFGCRPLVPDRLSYPELIPEEYHRDCLYRNEEDLYRRLRALCAAEAIEPPAGLSERMRSHSWTLRIREFDRMFAGAAGL